MSVKNDRLEFFMDDIVTAICLRNGDAYSKAEIIKKAADKYYKSEQNQIELNILNNLEKLYCNDENVFIDYLRMKINKLNQKMYKN